MRRGARASPSAAMILTTSETSDPRWTLLMPLFVGLGIALRVLLYLEDYSFNHDDICLALNVIGRDVSGLMQTLDFDQAAPLGFLWMERAVTLTLGRGERALLLMPVIFSCVSVLLIWALAAVLLPRFESLMVVGFFSTSQALIGSAIQFKPYSLEVLATIILTSLCVALTRDSVEKATLFAAGAAGTIALWLSFPTYFVLTGVGSATAGVALMRRNFVWLRRLLPVFLAWAISGGLAYWLSVRPGMLNLRLALMDASFEFPIHAPGQIVPWIAAAMWNLGFTITSVRLAPIAAAALVLALIVALCRRDRLGLMLAAPIGFCGLGAVMQSYPWLPRLILFLAPLVLILVAYEIGWLVRLGPARIRATVTCIVCAALGYATLSAIKNTALTDTSFDDPRGAVAAIASQWHQGDVIYASGAGLPVVIYYGSILDSIPHIAYVSGYDPAFVPGEAERRAPLPRTEGRLWFIYFEPNEKDFDSQTLAGFHQAGLLVWKSHYKKYAVSLWDLRGP
jgi:hypothetical protein